MAVIYVVAFLLTCFALWVAHSNFNVWQPSRGDLMTGIVAGSFGVLGGVFYFFKLLDVENFWLYSKPWVTAWDFILFIGLFFVAMTAIDVRHAIKRWRAMKRESNEAQ